MQSPVTLTPSDSFGTPSWSEDESLVAFTVAEPADDEGGKRPAAKFEHLGLPAFGETMPTYRASSIYVARVHDRALQLHKIVDSTVDERLAFGQPSIVSSSGSNIELFATAYSTLKDGGRLGFVCACSRCDSG